MGQCLCASILAASFTWIILFYISTTVTWGGTFHLAVALSVHYKNNYRRIFPAWCFRSNNFHTNFLWKRNQICALTIIGGNERGHFRADATPLWEMSPFLSWKQGRQSKNLWARRWWPPCYYHPLHSEVRERESERLGHQTHDDKHIDTGSAGLPAQHFSLNPAAKHAAGLTVATQSAKRHQKPSSAKYHYGL